MQAKTAFQQLVQALLPVHGESEANSIARIVFEDALDVPNSNHGTELSETQVRILQPIQKRLLEKEPVQYVLGEADFYGLKFKVSPDVLIPRSETEELVHWILSSHTKEQPLEVLDIGTGSGCIAITLKKKAPDWHVYGSDVSHNALFIAQENSSINHVNVDWIENDILQDGQWVELPLCDLIISNPPYIGHEEEGKMPASVLDFEPHLALFVEGGDPLLFYRVIARLGKIHLKPNGWIYFEVNEFRAKGVMDMLQLLGYTHIELQQDMQGKDRMLRACVGA